MPDLLNPKDFVEVYGNMVELGLRAGHTVQKGFERSVKEHLNYVESLVKGAMPALAKDGTSQDFFKAQAAGLEQARECLANTTKRLTEIQQEVGTELKALSEEAASKLSAFKAR